MKLVIVESPVKAKKISTFLESEPGEWIVLATGGHISNLPKNEHGVFKNNNQFTGKWVLERGKGKIVSAIAEQAKKSETVYVMTDPDREGEKIATDIITRAKLKNFTRVSSNEITKTKIMAALAQQKNPVNEHITEAQRARRLIDREIGYPLSQIIRIDFSNSNSAYTPRGIGRVISPALSIICEAEYRIDKYTPQKYWVLVADYLFEGEQFRAQCKQRFFEDDYEALQTSLGTIQSCQHIIADFKRDNKEHSPPPPLITSQMQHSGFYLYDFLPNKTMKIAQELFECGYITYIRSDSFFLSTEVVRDIINVVQSHFGPENTMSEKRLFDEPKRAQAGHEAIRPTSFEVSHYPKNIINLWRERDETINRKGEKFGEDHQKLYTFIFYRTMATQMKNSIYDASIATIQADEFVFEARANKQLFEGWEALGKKNVLGVEVADFMDREKALPYLSIGEPIAPMPIDTDERNTRRPDRYGVGRFITTLDQAGIARPSTVAGIVGSLKSKGYVDIKNGMLYPTETGSQINKWSQVHCDWLTSSKSAAEFEDHLDKIEKGEKQNADEFILAYHEKIEQLKKDLNITTSDTPEPSSKQADYAKSLAAKNGVTLPDEILADKKKMSEFIKKNKPATLGNCPECKKGEIQDRDKFYGCTNFNGGCKFAVWKDGITRFLGNFKIPHDDAGEEIFNAAAQNKPIHFDELHGKTKTFSAAVVLKKDTKWGWQLGLKF